MERDSRERCIKVDEWLLKLESLTAEHRELIATTYDQKILRIRARLHLEGVSEFEIEERTKWYRDRAKGQRWRVNRVLACKDEVLAITCTCCGDVQERSNGCGNRLYCFHCRTTYAFKRQEAFLSAHAAILREAYSLGLLWKNRRGGAYSDKLLTLTVPHLPDDTVQARIKRLVEAWPPFLKLLNAYRRDRGIPMLEWYRVIEWTEGVADKLGNPHFHIWLFGPYMDHALIRDWWAEGLRASGCPVYDEPIVDIRRSKGGIRATVRELIKYLTKDITSGGEQVPAEAYAEVIKALERKRTTQGSQGFMGRGEASEPLCLKCGSTLPKDVRRKPKGEPAREDGGSS